MQLNDASETNENVNKITKYEKMFKVRKILTAPSTTSEHGTLCFVGDVYLEEKVRVNFSISNVRSQS